MPLAKNQPAADKGVEHSWQNYWMVPALNCQPPDLFLFKILKCHYYLSHYVRFSTSCIQKSPWHNFAVGFYEWYT